MSPCKRSWLVAVLFILACLVAPARGQRGELEFESLVEETGCESTYSDEKKVDLFSTKYKDKEMTVTGLVAKVSRGYVMLKILPSSMKFDLRIKLNDPKSGYHLETGQHATIRFIVRTAGDCFLFYSGDQGVIVHVTS